MPNDQGELSVKEILSVIKSNMLPNDKGDADNDTVSQAGGDVPLNEENRENNSDTDDDVLDLTDEILDDEENEICSRPTAASRAASREESVISGSCAQKVFSRLDKLSETNSYNPISSGDIDLGKGLDMLLRQSLKAWMDANLPNIVERIVEKEIACLVEKYKK
ncbi:MAG: DUF2497 domain-containing protein [Holosporales bacterium]|jgi:cell pole-organizing protein PopZ|nr:DUF2497 domain-containing protein [Holosporales bacterium]